ncbi:MAG TPA: MBL fold metallo-hydrolase [Candidatus Gracilibacteria bacterium]|nr:MBL fold metallo-hydrolase [Candidatus Gracilibacteria bacterium]
MEIVWHGYSCLTVKSKGATTVIDPYTDGKGIKLPSLKGDIVIVSGNYEGHDNIKAVSGEPTVVDWPGEYEMKGVAVMAQQIPGSKGMLFTLIADNMKLCFIGNMSAEITEEMVEAIGDVDILLLPVGGGETADAKTAHNLVEEIEPRAILAIHYAVDGSKAKLDGPEAFLKLVGATSTEPKDKLSIQSRNELKQDATEVILLKPQLG